MNKKFYPFFIFAMFMCKDLSPMSNVQGINVGPYVCVPISGTNNGNIAYLNYQIYNTKAQFPTFFMSNLAPLFVTLVFIKNTTHATVQGFASKTPLSRYNLNTCPETIRLFSPAGENNLAITPLLSITLSAYLRKNLFQPVTCVNCSEKINNDEAAMMLKCMHAVHKKCYAKHCLEQRCRICDQTPGDDFWFELEAIPQNIP
jgi:hypothetical protein